MPPLLLIDVGAYVSEGCSQITRNLPSVDEISKINIPLALWAKTVRKLPVGSQ